MVNPKELRIGNKFYGMNMIQTVKEILDYGPTGSIQNGIAHGNAPKVDVTPEYSHLILVQENGNQYKPIELEPIPLTPEILEACGFVKDGFHGFSISVSPFEGQLKILYFHRDYLYMREGIKEDRREKDNICVLWNKDVMKEFYFHQLQNLFFCLVGKELEYSPVK